MAINSTQFSPGDPEAVILRKILETLQGGIPVTGGGGGGGGGAVTIADGADVALGSTTDPAKDGSTDGTAISFVRGIDVASQNLVVSTGSPTDSAVTNPTLSASIIAALKGILTDVNKIPTSPATDRTTAAAPSSVELSDGAAFYTAAKTGQLPTALVGGRLDVNVGASALPSGAATDASVVANQNVGGYTSVIKDTTAVSTSPAYTAGDAVGGKRTITGALRTSGGTGILESVQILDRANQKAAMELFIFDSDPSAATITDNSAFVFSTDDLKVLAHVTIAATDYVTINSKAIATIKGLGIALKGNATSTLYAALVTTGTPTYAATTDVQLIYGILQD